MHAEKRRSTNQIRLPAADSVCTAGFQYRMFEYRMFQYRMFSYRMIQFRMFQYASGTCIIFYALRRQVLHFPAPEKPLEKHCPPSPFSSFSHVGFSPFPAEQPPPLDRLTPAHTPGGEASVLQRPPPFSFSSFASAPPTPTGNTLWVCVVGLAGWDWPNRTLYRRM